MLRPPCSGSTSRTRSCCLVPRRISCRIVSLERPTPQPADRLPISPTMPAYETVPRARRPIMANYASPRSSSGIIAIIVRKA
jgi:hypothetical protein